MHNCNLALYFSFFFWINSEYIPVEWEILSWKTSHSARVGVWVCEKKTQETKGMHISVMITWPPPEIWANWVDRPQTHAPCRYVQTHTRPRLRQIQTTEDWNTNIITSSLGLWVILTIPLVTRFSLFLLCVESVSVFIGITTTTKPSSSLKRGTNRLKGDSFILITLFFFFYLYPSL